MTNKDLKGFSIARWVQEEEVILTDSNTYIGDDGTIIADGAVGGSSLVLINPDDGGQLNLFSASKQEGEISSLVFPSQLGIKNQHLRLKNTPSLDENTMYLEWADTTVGTVTSISMSTTSSGLIVDKTAITSNGTINIDLNSELQALAEITDNGLIVRTDNGYISRTITTDTENNNLIVTNGDAIVNNPTITLNSKISNLDLIETKTLISNEMLQTKSLKIVNDSNKTLILVSSTEQLNDNIILTMPIDVGLNEQYLKTDGQGNLSWGTITSESGGTVTAITAGTGLDGGVINTVGTISLKDTTVQAGTYSYMTGTVDAQGRLTKAYSSINTVALGEQAKTAGTETLQGINGITITTAAVKEDSIILVTRNMGTGTLPVISTVGNLIVGDIQANLSFKVYSTVDGDVGKFNWLIINA